MVGANRGGIPDIITDGVNGCLYEPDGADGGAASLIEATRRLLGKTGTAEDSTGGPDHAWFGCYAPYPDGKIVVVAFAQNTPGGGSVHALPMAKKVLAEWERNRQR